MRHARVFAAALAFSSALFAQSVPTTLNYQGRLTDNSVSQSPVNAVVNMQFEIWDASSGGVRLWAEPAAGSFPVLVVNGIFNVQLGGNGVPLSPSIFSGGTTRYLQILANGELLTPRQKISATAYAGKAENAAAAATFTGALAGDVTGTQGATSVTALRGVPVAPTAPAGGQLLSYNSANSRWEPGSGAYPASCGAGEVIMSSGPSAWRCGLICNYPFADCDLNTGNGCESNTTSDPNHCGSCATACTGGAVCVGSQCRLPNGQACTFNAECQSTSCIDTVCCNSACVGTCQRCNLAGSVGTCSNIPVGQDPDNECTGALACDGAGACQLKANGQVCGTNSECQSNSCTDGVCCNSSCSGTCQSCNQAGSVGTCSNVPNGQDPDNECAGALSCNGAGACYKATGAACAISPECQSGFCTDNVCCNSSCGSLCQACSAAKNGGTNGTCGFVIVGTDPDSECAGALNCNGAGACF